MKIEVVAPESDPAKTKGDLLETFAHDFLLSQNFEVENQIRVTATELDLLCKHKINGRKVYVECKAYRETISASILTKLLGTVMFHSYEEGWLITTGQLGKDAKGFQQDWESRPVSERQKLSIYTSDRVIDGVIHAGVLKPAPQDPGRDVPNSQVNFGDWMLLISPYGKFWVAPILEGGVPAAVIVYNADTGTIIRDPDILKRLATTDCSLRNLDFEKISGWGIGGQS